MHKKQTKIATLFAATLAMGILIVAPFASPAAVYAQVSSSSSNGIENGLTLIVDKIREEIADLVEDANDDDDTEDDYNDLVEEVADDEDVEQDIQDSLDDVRTVIEGTLDNDAQEVADVLTEFTENEIVVEPEDLPDDITSDSVAAAIDSISTEEVAEELTIAAITDEVLGNNTGLVDEVQAITNDFISESLSQPDADLSELVEDVQDDIEDAVDEHVDEDEVADVISDLSEDDIIDAVDNDDVNVDAAVTEAVVRELEEPDEDATQQDDGTETAGTSELEDLRQEVQDLRNTIAQLRALIQSMTSGESTGNQTTPTSPMTNSTG
jgi:hypothetical protein